MNVFVVFVFGALGGMARLTVNTYLPEVGAFPLATLSVNLLGCFSLAFLVKNYMIRKEVAEIWIMAAGTGFLGGFTSFSSAILDSFKLFASKEYILAVSYVLLEIIGGLAMIYLGTRMVRRLIKT